MITKRQELGMLSSEELTQWRAIIARENAIKLNPTVYSQAETESNQMQYLAFMGRMARDYNVVEIDYEWGVSSYTGLVWQREPN